MALGTIRRQVQTPTFSQSQATPAAFGSGVASAITSLAGAVQDFETTRQNLTLAITQRQQRQESFDVQRRFIEHESAVAQFYATRTRESTDAIGGFTDSIDADIRRMNDEFLQTVPPALRGQYEVQIAQLQETKILEAFNFEYNQGNEFFRIGVQDSMNQVTSALQAGDLEFEDAVGQVHDLIASSDLPELEKQNMYRSTSAVLASIQFSQEVTAAAQANAPVRDWANGSDVVAPGLMPAERAALNAISGPESGGRYDVRYGGANGAQTFTDFSDHPRIFETRPDGRVSSAAGRYQFTVSTWDRAVAMFNAQNPSNPVTDFSPVAQDRIAAFWVRYQFNTRNRRGLDFDQVINSGNAADIAYIRQTLVPEWEGLGNLSDAEWVSSVTSMAAEGGTGTAQAPDIWTDPRFMDVPYDAKLALAGQAQAQIAATQAQMAEQAALARSQQLDDMNRQAYEGTLGIDAIPAAWEAGIFQTVEEERTFRERVAQGREREQSVLEVQEGFALGIPLNPVTAGPGLDSIIGDQARQALFGQDGQAGARVAQIVQQAGFIPPETLSAFNSMLTGANGDQRAFALGVLSSLPDRLLAESGITTDQAADIRFFRDNAPFFEGNPAGQREILAQLDALRSGMTTEQMEVFRTRAVAAFDEQYVSAEALTGIYDGWFNYEPEPPPVQGGARTQFVADARAAYIQGFTSYGTPEGAQTYMETYLQSTWGPTEVGGNGNYLVKHPPEMTYSSMRLNGSLSWMDAQIRQDFEVPPGAMFQLVAEPATISDMQSGVPNPRYGVVVTDESGISHYMPDLYQGELTEEIRGSARNEASQVFADRRVEEMRYRRDRAEQVIRDMVFRDAPQAEIERAQAEYERALTDFNNAEAARQEAFGPGIGPQIAPESVNDLLPGIVEGLRNN